MSPTSVNRPNSSTYIIDAADRLEYVRQADQERLFSAETGGLFPEQADPKLPGVTRILDVACGTGSWVLNVAFANPHIEVVGIDIDHDMVQYARTYAQVQGLDDMTSFRVMDIRQPLDFPDHSFDLVNARFLVGVLDPASWASLVAECVRITVPGGIIRLTEVECWSSTGGPLHRLFALLSQALHETGRSYSPDGRTFGIAPLLPQLLRAAGVQDILLHPFVLDASAQAPRHVGWCDNLHTAFYLLKPFLVETAHLIAAAEYDCLLNEAELAMYGSDFCVLAFGLIAWGVTPLPRVETASLSAPSPGER